MVAMTAAMIAIAWPYDWLAGLFAGVLFAMIHAADGPKGAGQRDAVMAVLMVDRPRLSAARRSRRRAAAWMALGGFFFGMATAVKPTIAPLGLVLLLLAALRTAKEGRGRGAICGLRRAGRGRVRRPVLWDTCCTIARWTPLSI